MEVRESSIFKSFNRVQVNDFLIPFLYEDAIYIDCRDVAVQRLYEIYLVLLH